MALSKLSEWRGRLRIGSALVLLSFVTTHLVAHCFLLVSFETADAVRRALMYPWRTTSGTVLLATAFVVHFCNALWSLYRRRSLRLSRWEGTQLALGLSIPFLLMAHVVGTPIAEATLDVTPGYNALLVVQWMLAPWLGLLQITAVLIVWTHAMIGMDHWLGTKPSYSRWRPLGFAFALLLPALALAGYVSGGNEVLREARTPDFVRTSLAQAHITAQTLATSARRSQIGWAIFVALLLLPVVGRSVRSLSHRRRKPAMLTHAGGRSLPVYPGATVLETLRAHRIPHASVCGGRARCTTCRVMVTEGLDRLPPPSSLEAKALTRIGATAQTRLACQIRPTADLAVIPLLAADAGAADGAARGGLAGSERPITVVFVDLRGSTSLGEAKLPYDVLFILNQFFHEMTEALARTRGYYSQFTGDGLMALYGLHTADAGAGVIDAFRGAREMLARLDRLNQNLRADLRQPLQIGIGIHHSEAIVGTMGPPRSRIVTAIGDTVNTCARLEGLTRDLDCVVIASREAVEAAELDLSHLPLREAPVRGRSAPVQFYAFATAADLPEI